MTRFPLPARLVALALLLALVAIAPSPSGWAAGASSDAAGSVPGVAFVTPRCAEEGSPTPLAEALAEDADREDVQKANAISESDLTLLEEDESALLGVCDRILYAEPIIESAALPAGQGAAGAAPAPSVDVLALSSLPGSAHTIYLDFTGETTSGTAWNLMFGSKIVSPAYSIAGPADTNFDEQERAAIYTAWRAVAEDFAPFDVNVTTADPGIEALTRRSWSDSTFGVRVVVTGVNAVSTACKCAGLSFVDVFDQRNSNFLQPVWAFAGAETSGYDIAQIVSHEVGHSLGLLHDGVVGANGRQDYYFGDGSWAPIMGAAYGRRVSQWSAGEYSGATNNEDDVAAIADVLSRRPDDHADTATAATPLGVGTPVSGIIGHRGDVDVFSASLSGRVQIEVSGPEGVSNADLSVSLVDANGTPLTMLEVAGRSEDPVENSLNTVWNADLPAASATYGIRVGSAGAGDPRSPGGYSDYGSLGQYSVLVTTRPADPVAAPQESIQPGADNPQAPTKAAPVGAVTADAPEFTTAKRLIIRKSRFTTPLRFTGDAERYRVKGKIAGLRAQMSKGRVLLKGSSVRSGRHKVTVELIGQGGTARRTFVLDVRT